MITNYSSGEEKYLKNTKEDIYSGQVITYLFKFKFFYLHKTSNCFYEKLRGFEKMYIFLFESYLALE